LQAKLIHAEVKNQSKNETFFCYQFLSGDSGSPVQSVDSTNGKGKFIQYGIVSYGVAKCDDKEGFPGIYTSVSKYLNWILDNMQ
jgi:secreted trypsin-like serine protease